MNDGGLHRVAFFQLMYYHEHTGYTICPDGLDMMCDTSKEHVREGRSKGVEVQDTIET